MIWQRGGAGGLQDGDVEVTDKNKSVGPNPRGAGSKQLGHQEWERKFLGANEGGESGKVPGNQPKGRNGTKVRGGVTRQGRQDSSDG